MRYRFDVLRDVPALGLRRGDSLTYDPANVAEPYLLHRPIYPDPGALLVALNEGALEGTTPPALAASARPAAPRALRLLPRDVKQA